MKFTDRTLKQRFNNEWNLSKRTKFKNGNLFRTRITYLLCILGANDDTILKMVRENRFIMKIKKILADIRRKKNLYRRTRNSEENNRRIIEFLIELLQNDYLIDDKDRTSS
jgi:hypothetical protein